MEFEDRYDREPDDTPPDPDDTGGGDDGGGDSGGPSEEMLREAFGIPWMEPWSDEEPPPGGPSEEMAREAFGVPWTDQWDDWTPASEPSQGGSDEGNSGRSWAELRNQYNAVNIGAGGTPPPWKMDSWHDTTRPGDILPNGLTAEASPFVPPIPLPSGDPGWAGIVPPTEGRLTGEPMPEPPATPPTMPPYTPPPPWLQGWFDILGKPFLESYKGAKEAWQPSQDAADQRDWSKFGLANMTLAPRTVLAAGVPLVRGYLDIKDEPAKWLERDGMGSYLEIANSVAKGETRFGGVDDNGNVLPPELIADHLPPERTLIIKALAGLPDVERQEAIYQLKNMAYSSEESQLKALQEYQNFARDGIPKEEAWQKAIDRNSEVWKETLGRTLFDPLLLLGPTKIGKILDAPIDKPLGFAAGLAGQGVTRLANGLRVAGLQKAVAELGTHNQTLRQVEGAIRAATKAGLSSDEASRQLKIASDLLTQKAGKSPYIDDVASKFVELLSKGVNMSPGTSKSGTMPKGSSESAKELLPGKSDAFEFLLDLLESLQAQNQATAIQGQKGNAPPARPKVTVSQVPPPAMTSAQMGRLLGVQTGFPANDPSAWPVLPYMAPSRKNQTVIAPQEFEGVSTPGRLAAGEILQSQGFVPSGGAYQLTAPRVPVIAPEQLRNLPPHDQKLLTDIFVRKGWMPR